MFILLLIDVFALCVISSLFGAGCYLLGQSFWVGFLFSLWGVIICGLLFNQLFLTKANKKVAELNYKTAQIVSTQEVVLECTYCKTSNVVLLAKGNMDFECTNCKNKNRVMHSYTTAQISTPIDSISDTSLLDLIPNSELDKPSEEETDLGI